MRLVSSELNSKLARICNHFNPTNLLPGARLAAAINFSCRLLLAGISGLLLAATAVSADVYVKDAEVAEGNAGSTILKFDIVRNGDTSSPVRVLLETASGGSEPATAGTDYTSLPPGTTVTIPAGLPMTQASVELLADTSPELNETLLLNLISARELSGTVDFAVGDTPVVVTSIDVDDDGRLDLVVGNISSNNISVLRNNSTKLGEVSFVAAANFTVGDNPQWVTSADVDDDGLPDLVVTNSSDDDISVLLNTSTGPGDVRFATAVNFGTGWRPQSITSTDVDADGLPDLLIANVFDGDISVLRNTSTGPGNVNFSTAVDFDSGDGPTSIASTDVDADGLPDMLIANFFDDDISVLRNTSTGPGDVSFTPAVDFGVGDGPSSIVTADVDADGRPDLIIANATSDNVSVLRNNSSGPGVVNFVVAMQFVTGDTPQSMTTADVDQDGLPDLITPNLSSDDISVIRNTSTGPGIVSFAAKEDFPVGNGPRSVTSGDLDGDGLPDLIATNFHDDNVSVLRNPVLHIPVSDSQAIGTILNDDIASASSAQVNDVNGQPVTFATDAGTINNLRRVNQSGAPNTLMFPNGFFSFDITGITNNQSVQITMTLPAGSAPEKLIKCIPIGCVEFPSLINGDQVVFTLTDGGAGDADGMVNAMITDPVGPATTPPGPTGATGATGPAGTNGTNGDDGSSFGCTVGKPINGIDPTMPLLMLLSLLVLNRRRLNL